MSFFGSIGKSLGSFIKPLASIALKAVAPAAANMLKGIVGDLFTKGGDFLKGLTSGLPGPLASLASNLIGKGVGALTNLAEGGINSLLSKITGGAHTVDAGGTQVAVPGITTRPPATNTTSSASTATVASPNYGTGNNIGTAGASSGIGALPNLNTTSSDQIKAELKAKYPNLKPEDLDMMAAQEAEQRYNRMISLLTQLLTMKHEATKSIIQNFRA
jgi:hypothetical protein